MSAIEMMDPKMDAGMVSHQTGNKVYNFEQSIAEDRIKIKDLELPELIGIIDTTLACIVSLLVGFCMESVFPLEVIIRPNKINILFPVTRPTVQITCRP